MTFLTGEVNSSEMFYLLGVEGKEVKIPSTEQKLHQTALIPCIILSYGKCKLHEIFFLHELSYGTYLKQIINIMSVTVLGLKTVHGILKLFASYLFAQQCCFIIRMYEKAFNSRPKENQKQNLDCYPFVDIHADLYTCFFLCVLT